MSGIFNIIIAAFSAGIMSVLSRSFFVRFCTLCFFSAIFFSCSKHSVAHRKPPSSSAAEILSDETEEADKYSSFKSFPGMQGDAAAFIRMSDSADVFTRFTDSLSIEEKLCQLFIVSIDGTELRTSAVLYDIPPGGYILFNRNFTGTPEQIIDLTSSVQTFYASRRRKKPTLIPPFFSIDHEGGEVNRLRGIASPLPSAQSVARFLSPDKAEKLYLYAAQQLAALGIHVNFAPIAETAGTHNAEFLSRRSFGSPEQTQTYASVFMNAFYKGGVFCVLKHFPGNTNEDPHNRLPVLKGNAETIRERYLSSFTSLFSSIPPCSAAFLHNSAAFPASGVLMSHALIPVFDEINPACFSPAVVTQLLKNELHFAGLIFSDDLYMGAVDSDGTFPVVAVEKALRAGVHIFMLSRPLYSDFIPVLAQKLASDPDLQKATDEAVKQILRAKLCMGLLSLTESNGVYELMPAAGDEPTAGFRLQSFNEAKRKGDALYYEYWTK